MKNILIRLTYGDVFRLDGNVDVAVEVVLDAAVHVDMETKGSANAFLPWPANCGTIGLHVRS
ncbi:hypothetical protein AWM70_14885 [Paenibacillus yonginensis]|uniref:Uncharacterized protein n=1 Tax=Paenibacillus yonginensis TaxID=1462996 RepID=A0A1B1N2U5_9BACL|nr:hypothetical protein AWM70_14885 [Paenibacillus yonginensis]